MGRVYDRPTSARIHPNPFAESLTIHDLEGIYAVTITDMLGRTLYRQPALALSAGGTTIMPNIEASGIYLVTAEREGELRIQKVVRQ